MTNAMNALYMAVIIGGGLVLNVLLIVILAGAHGG
jgi:hypothetical protein